MYIPLPLEPGGGRWRPKTRVTTMSEPSHHVSSVASWSLLIPLCDSLDESYPWIDGTHRDGCARYLQSGTRPRSSRRYLSSMLYYVYAVSPLNVYFPRAAVCFSTSRRVWLVVEFEIACRTNDARNQVQINTYRKSNAMLVPEAITTNE